MLAQSSLEILNPMSIFEYICGRRQKLQPNRVQFQPAQAKHPLQRNRENAAALAIFRGKPAPEKNRHASRIAILLACSSTKRRDLEDTTVRQVCFALRLMTGAKSAVRDRLDGAEQLRLLPRIERFLQIVGHGDQLRLAEGRAVH